MGGVCSSGSKYESPTPAPAAPQPKPAQPPPPAPPAAQPEPPKPSPPPAAPQQQQNAAPENGHVKFDPTKEKAAVANGHDTDKRPNSRGLSDKKTSMATHPRFADMKDDEKKDARAESGTPVLHAGSIFRKSSKSESFNKNTPTDGKSNINPDQYETIEDVQKALKEAGLHDSALIVGVDFTKSNEENGMYSHDGDSLHKIYEDGRLNPYQEVISTIGRTLASFDDDGLIPTYGFGDALVKDRECFSLAERLEGTDRPCKGFEEVLEIYKKILDLVELDGPTSYTPIISKAIEIVQRTKQYHILLIITDGVTLTEELDRRAIREASNYPLSIVIVGVGDGPWGQVKILDDLEGRKFDNVQFVNYEKIRKKHAGQDSKFAATALQEIPPQYRAIQSLGLLEANAAAPAPPHAAPAS